MAKIYADYSVYERLRDEKQMTDYAVAQAAGVASSTMTNWKQGEYTPKADKLFAIANVLGVPLDALYSVGEK